MLLWCDAMHSVVSVCQYVCHSGVLYWKELTVVLVSLWRDPDDVSHCRIQSPDKTEWRLISATLCGWGHCFVADQLWLMTRIREEEEEDWKESTFPQTFIRFWRGPPYWRHALNADWISKIRFSANISLYLGNDTRKGHCCCGMPDCQWDRFDRYIKILLVTSYRTNVCSLTEWCHFQWPRR